MFVFTLILVLPLLCLTACGLRPLYGSHAAGSLQKELREIKLNITPNREGQILQNYLSQMFGKPDTKQTYSLTTEIYFTKKPLAISKTASTVQEGIFLLLKLKLEDIRSGKIILNMEETFSIDSTVSAESPYANWVGEKSAQERLIYEAAESIRTSISMAIKSYTS